MPSLRSTLSDNKGRRKGWRKGDGHFAHRALVGLACLLAGTLSIATSASAEERRIDALCATLERPNIDCACVARRVDHLETLLPDGVNPDFLREGYAAAVGTANGYEAALQALMAQPAYYYQAEIALNDEGGRPSSISDYETGCVIAGARRPTLPTWPQEPMTEEYVKRCSASTGDTRYCQCAVARARGRLDKREFEAYVRSFTDYSDIQALTTDEMNRSRGDSMGLSGEQFAALTTQARNILDEKSDEDTAYCEALLWADQAEGSDAATREAQYTEAARQAAVEEEAAQQEAVAQAAAGSSRYPEALEVIARGCAADGKSAEFCGCLVSNMESDVFPRVDSDSIAMAFALINYGAGLDPMDMVQRLAAMNSQDQVAAAMLSGQVDASEGCN